MRFRQLRIPIPSPGARTRDCEERKNSRRDESRIRAFETAPAFADSAEPIWRPPGNIAEDLSGNSPQKGAGGSSPFNRFGNRRGSFHRLDTPGHQKSFRRLFLANFLG